MTPIHSAQLPGLSLAASTHAPGSVLPRHTHAGPTVCCVLDGGFTEYWRGHALECAPATVKVTPAGEPHWNRFGTGETRGLMVEIGRDFEAAGDSRRLGRTLDELIHVSGGAPAAIARRIWLELRARDAAAALALEGLILELLAALVRGGGGTPGERGALGNGAGSGAGVPGVSDGWTPSGVRAPQWLLDVRDRLHDVAASPSLQSLAESAGVHPATLTRAFRRAYGLPPGEYLRRLRLERAIHATGTSRRPLAEIALEAGFSDQAHFTRAFKRATGWTPAAYRRAMG